MTHPKMPAEPRQAAPDELADLARVALWGLAMMALAEKGKASSLAAIDEIAAGNAHLTFVVEMQGEQTMIVGQLNRGTDLLPLLTVRISTPGGGGPTAH